MISTATQGKKSDDPNALGWLALASGVGFFALSAVGIAKAVLPTFHLYGLYFWLTNYRHGFVRRGLVGSLLAPLLDGRSATDLPWVILIVHFATLGFLLLACAVIGVLAVARCGVRMAVALALFAVAPFLGSVAFNLGYPDALLGLLIIIGALLLRGPAPWWMIAAWLVVTALIHETALLVTLCLASPACLRDAAGDRIAGIVIGGLLGVAVVLAGGAHDPDLASRVVEAGFPADRVDEYLRTNLGQTLPQAATQMARNWSSNPVRGVVGVAYAALPALAMVVLFWRGEAAGVRLATLLGGLGPVMLLGLAWDVTRIGAIANLTTFLAVALFARPPPAAVRPVRPVVVGTLICVLYLALPVLDLRLPYEARPVNLVRLGAVCRSCADAGRVFADWYHVRFPDKLPPSLDPLLGNVR